MSSARKPLTNKPSPKSTPSPAPAAGGPDARSTKRIVVGISGASGAAYATRLLEQLLVGGHEVHLVVSEYGRRLLADELGIKHLSLDELVPTLTRPVQGRARANPNGHNNGRSNGSASSHTNARASGGGVLGSPRDIERRLFIHPHKDVGAVIASGSFLHDGMVVIPCSSTTLGAIASGSGSNLLCRAAMVTLKERRRLVLVHRESPLSLIDIRNMEQVTLGGGIIAPANPGFYLLPKSLDDIVDFVVGKCLDLFNIEHELNVRWSTKVSTNASARSNANTKTQEPSASADGQSA